MSAATQHAADSRIVADAQILAATVIRRVERELAQVSALASLAAAEAKLSAVSLILLVLGVAFTWLVAAFAWGLLIAAAVMVMSRFGVAPSMSLAGFAVAHLIAMGFSIRFVRRVRRTIGFEQTRAILDEDSA